MSKRPNFQVRALIHSLDAALRSMRAEDATSAAARLRQEKLKAYRDELAAREAAEPRFRKQRKSSKKTGLRRK
jgi:hypothetical protein